MMYISYSSTSDNEVESMVDAIKQQLYAGRNRQNSSAMAAYMKHQFSFLGIKKDQRTHLSSDWIKTASKLENSQLRALVEYLWNLEEREFQYVALDLLLKKKKVRDVNEIEFIQSLLIRKSWWDTVDLLASHKVGSFFLVYPDLIPVKLDEWNAGQNKWLIRTGIIFQLKYKTKTDQDLLFALCEMHGRDKEFFIAKAIGWALREWAKIRPAEVKQFVSNTYLQPLSKREALKHFK